MSESEKIKRGGRMPYVIEFAKFFSGFIIVIGIALLLLRVVSAAAAAQEQAVTSAVQGSAR